MCLLVEYSGLGVFYFVQVGWFSFLNTARRTSGIEEDRNFWISIHGHMHEIEGCLVVGRSRQIEGGTVHQVMDE